MHGTNFLSGRKFRDSTRFDYIGSGCLNGSSLPIRNGRRRNSRLISKLIFVIDSLFGLEKSFRLGGEEVCDNSAVFETLVCGYFGTGCPGPESYSSEPARRPAAPVAGPRTRSLTAGLCAMDIAARPALVAARGQPNSENGPPEPPGCFPSQAAGGHRVDFWRHWLGRPVTPKPIENFKRASVIPASPHSLAR